MAATQTVVQSSPQCNSSNPVSDVPFECVTPRQGVVTLFGYGIKVRVERSHLEFEDGIGAARRQGRLPRVGHGLRRLVVISADGMVSLAALRWLADQDASFVLLDRDGSVLFTTGPVRSSDARLRRAQALAARTGVDVTIARELISQKLAGQERVAREKLRDNTAAEAIADYRLALAEAETLDAIRTLESRGAASYWSAWGEVPISFPKTDLSRVPEHWRTFGTRKSLLTGSPRLATNPANAMLNYLYALLESESRLAAAALGLDPGLGFIHVDTPARDSLACDLMEAVRPQVDNFVLDWILSQPLKRDWFFEQRDGTCRLMASFAARLSETTATWSRAVGPVAETVVRILWSTLRKPSREYSPATRLTQAHKRAAKGSSVPPIPAPPHPTRLCETCGVHLKRGIRHCGKCAVAASRERMLQLAKRGRVAAHSPEAKARRVATQRQNMLARWNWDPTSQPAWLNEKTYVASIQPKLATIKISSISTALGISEAYASGIRAGRRRPHPRHWQNLAKLVGVSDKQRR